MYIAKTLDWLALVAYCGLIFWLSHQESLPMPAVFEFQDKLLHFGAYAVMAGLAWRAFRHQNLTHRQLVMLSVVFCSLYGFTDEWHQSFVPGRNSSIGDWLADSLGGISTAIVLFKLGLKQRH